MDNFHFLTFVRTIWTCICLPLLLACKTIAFIECARWSRFNSSRETFSGILEFFSPVVVCEKGFGRIRIPTDDGSSQEEQQHVYGICPARLRLVTINAQTHMYIVCSWHMARHFLSVRHRCLSFYTTTDGCMRTD